MGRSVSSKSSKSAAKGVSAKSHKGFKRGGGGAKKKPSKPFKGKAKREGEKESNVVGALSSKGGRKRAASAPGEEDSDHKKQKVVPSTKEKRVYRKQQRSDFELVRESKVIWEHLRQHSGGPGRTLALEEMVAMAQGHFKELSLKHDTARVVQSCLKYGTSEHRTCVFSELKDHIVELSKLKYAKFVVKSLLKYCSPEERGHVINSFYGHVRKLIRHSEASVIVELAYNDYANARQRTALAQEFYGTEFALFKETPIVGGCGLKETPIVGGCGLKETPIVGGYGLKEVLLAHPTQTKGILAHMRDSLLAIMEKTVIRHSIVHKALLDYLISCSSEARAEIIESLREVVAEILHTKDGSRVAMHCLWYGTAKDRKIIVKSFKSLTVKICKEENGHLVLMALLDSVDDTVLIKKAILSEMKDHLKELCSHQYGRRVILYILSPRAPRHFSSQFLSLLIPGDGNPHSKKPASLRNKELLEFITPSLLSVGASCAVEWAKDKKHAPIFIEMANSLSGDLSPLYQPLLDVVCTNKDDLDDDERLVTHECGHWVIKRLVEIDHIREQTEGGGIGFIESFLSRVNPEMMRCLVLESNRGASIVQALLGARGEGEGAERLMEIFRPLKELLTTSLLKGHRAILTCLGENN